MALTSFLNADGLPRYPSSPDNPQGAAQTAVTQHHGVAGRRVAAAGEIAAEPCDLGQVEGQCPWSVSGVGSPPCGSADEVEDVGSGNGGGSCSYACSSFYDRY